MYVTKKLWCTEEEFYDIIKDEIIYYEKELKRFQNRKDQTAVPTLSKIGRCKGMITAYKDMLGYFD